MPGCSAQVASSKTFDPATNAWIETQRTDYHATTALPLRQYAYGALHQTLTYHVDGTLASVSDARDSAAFDTTVQYLDWHRGTPRRVVHPDGTQVRAGVNGDGTIAWVVDETGAKTCHSYDAMGRWAGTVYPSEKQPGVCDASAWRSTVATFGPSSQAQLGIAAGIGAGPCRRANSASSRTSMRCGGRSSWMCTTRRMSARRRAGPSDASMPTGAKPSFRIRCAR